MPTYYDPNRIDVEVLGVPLITQNLTDAASVQQGIFRGGRRATPADNDESYHTYQLMDSAGNEVEYARFTWSATDVTDSSKDAVVNFKVLRDNLLETALQMDANNAIFPGTGAVTLPSGTTAERPAIGVAKFRHNTTTERVEYIDGDGTGEYENLSKVYDIRRFGAKIDGATDDTGAWNAAIAKAVADGGGVVIHPGGNSLCTGTILWKEGVSIVGMSGGGRANVCRITHAPVTNIPLISGLDTPPVTAYNGFGRFENLVLTGDPTKTTYLLDVFKPGLLHITRVWFEDPLTACLRIVSGIHTVISRCRFDAGVDSAAYCIHYDTHVTFNGTTLYIENSSLREGSWSIRTEPDALADLHVSRCYFESMVNGIAQLSEGGVSNRAHFFFEDCRGEGINRGGTKSAAFEVGVGSGSNAVYFYAKRIWLSGENVRDDRTCFQIERAIATIEDIYVNRFTDGIFSTTSSSTVSVNGHISLRSDEHQLMTPADIADLGNINWQASWGNNRSTSEKVVQQFIATTGSVSTVDTTFSLPQHVIPTRVHFHVKDAITGAVTWDADFITGLTKKILSGEAIAHDTATGKLITGSPRTSGTLNIRLTANGGNFTGGNVVVTLWYLDIADRSAPLNLLQLPFTSTGPAVSSAGDLQIDDTLVEWTDGYLRYYDGATQMLALAMPAATFEAPTNGYVPAYNSTTDELEWVANGAASLWTDAGTVIHPTTTTRDVAFGGTGATAPFFFSVSGADMQIQGAARPTLTLTNPNADNTQYSDVTVISDASNPNRSASFRSHAASFVSGSTASKPNSLLILSNSSNSNGISIVSRSAAGDIRFYTGGIADGDECVQIDSEGRLELAQQDHTENAWGTKGIILNSLATTYTDGSTVSGTVAAAHFHTFQQPTLAASSLSITTTDSATVYIAAAPLAGANQTITNPWALFIAAGNTRIGSELHWSISGQSIVSDAGGLTYNAPTSDTHDFRVNGISQLEITSTQVNFQSNTIVSANFSAGAIDDIGELAASIRTGVDLEVVTGTAGSSTEVGYWNADGDLIGDSSFVFNSGSNPSIHLIGTSTTLILVTDGTRNVTVTASVNGATLGCTSGHDTNLISNNATALRVDNDSTARNTRLWIYDVDNGTLERVSVGDANSGGTDYKLLRIPN